MDQPTRILSLPTAPRSFGHFVDGASVVPGSRVMMERRSPGHGVAVTRVPQCTMEDLNAAVTAARRAFEDGRWSGLSGAERAGVLLRTATGLRLHRDEIAYWEVLENGKPISQA